MPAQLSGESDTMLRAYLDGQLGVGELAEWLTDREYDVDLPLNERDELAALALIVLEVQEQMREKDEILTTVVQMLGTRKPVQRANAATVSSSTASSPTISVTSEPTPVQRVNISGGTAAG